MTGTALAIQDSYPDSAGEDILLGVKTTIDVNRDLAHEAAKLLGTQTLKETVNAALRDVVARSRRRRLADRVREGSLPVPTLEELARLRDPQVPVGSLRPLRPRRQ